MTVTKDLFLSILSMDAYNRGYGAGISGLGGSGSKLGNATVGQDATQLLEAGTAEAASFYAISYKLDEVVGESGNTISAGSTIISYRGTDAPLYELLFVDWPISYFGTYDKAQIVMASQYKQLVDPNGTENLILTGHSLGGALAGFTSAMLGEEAVMVDNIGFTQALHNLIVYMNDVMSNNDQAYRSVLSMNTYGEAAQQLATLRGLNYADTTVQTVIESLLSYNYQLFQAFNVSGQTLLDEVAIFSSFLNGDIRGFHLEGSIAEDTRNLPPNSVATLQADIGDLTNYGLSGTQAHSASLNVIMKYADQEKGTAGFLKFKSVLIDAAPALFDDDIANRSGFVSGGITGTSDANAKMRDAIAYSAIDEGTRIFGDTGIRSFFDDLSALGSKVESSANFLQDADTAIFGNEIGYDTLRRSVVEAVTQFAGLCCTNPLRGFMS